MCKKLLKLKEGAVVFIMLSITAMLLYDFPVMGKGNLFSEEETSLSQIKNGVSIVDHAICKGVINGKPVEVTKRFLSDETVFCWVRVANRTENCDIDFLFQGPNGIDCPSNAEWSDGDCCYAKLELNKYETIEVVGDWKVTVYINGKEALTDNFVVVPLGGLVWWGPFVGLLTIPIFAIVVYLLLKKILRGRSCESSSHTKN